MKAEGNIVGRVPVRGTCAFEYVLTGFCAKSGYRSAATVGRLQRDFSRPAPRYPGTVKVRGL